MASDPAALYIVIAPITAAFAGFGSLANSLGPDRGGDDARLDAFRLSTMLFASLSATLLGLLPATIEGLGVDANAAERLAALAGALAIAVYVPMGLGRVRKIRGVTGYSRLGGAANSLSLAVAFVGFAGCAGAIRSELTAGFYLLGLMGLLSSSVVMFWRVIASMLRPAHGS
ncbi:MAG TPA: hypothetical protein VIV07_02505 [Sphingomicrobium sp.]